MAKEIKNVEEEDVKVVDTEVVETEESETTEEPIKGGFFRKMKKKVGKKINDTKYKMEVNGEINTEFSENAVRFHLVDEGVKGLLKPLLEVDEEAKTFTSLGKANFKDNTLLKNKEGQLFKIVSRLEGEHTRTFIAKEIEHIRDLEIYNYKEV
jgi:hypothetical protein